MADVATQYGTERRSVALAELAERQYGVVVLAQLQALGLSSSGVRSRVARGQLHRIHRGVYAIGHPILTRNGRWLAAVLACGPHAALSHRSAAALHGLLDTARSAVDVSVRRATARPRPGIDLHNARRLEIAIVDRIPSTTVPRTIVDLADVEPARRVERAIGRADQLRVFDLRALERELPGRRGAAVVRAILSSYREPTITRNDMEEAFLALCRAAGIPDPLVNARVNDFEVDFQWPHARLIAETDGRETHETRQAFEEDRHRDQVHAVNGWRVLRFTWRQVIYEPAYVAQTVTAVLTVYTSSIVNASSPTSRNFV